MAGGGKGGSQTVKNEVEIPEWAERAAKRNIDRADRISQIGYVPNYGPQIAALQPMQEAARRNTNNMASAFGMAGANPMAQLPQPENFGGFQAYSTGDLYQANLDRLKERDPEQFEAIEGLTRDWGRTVPQNAGVGRPQSSLLRSTSGAPIGGNIMDVIIDRVSDEGRPTYNSRMTLGGK